MHRIANGAAIGLNAVSKIIEEKSVRELPDIVPFSVHEYLIGKAVSTWQSICLDSFVEVEELLKSLVGNLCKRYFDRFRSSGLLHSVEYYNHELNLSAYCPGWLLVNCWMGLLPKHESKLNCIAEWKLDGLLP